MVAPSQVEEKVVACLPSSSVEIVAVTSFVGVVAVTSFVGRVDGASSVGMVDGASLMVPGP